jgi:hypothetical protein
LRKSKKSVFRHRLLQSEVSLHTSHNRHALPTPNHFHLATENIPPSLLDAQPDLARTADAHDYTLVHAAASHGHADLVRALVGRHWADAHAVDETALLQQCSARRLFSMMWIGPPEQEPPRKGLRQLSALPFGIT